MRLGRASGVCALLVALSLPGLSRADAGEVSPEKRALPDYDGREASTSTGEVLLWVPRILLSPLYLVSEFVVRRPLGYLVSAAERAKLPEFLYDLFLFGPNHQAGILPVAFVDFGFYPSYGLFFFWNDFVPHQDLVVRGSMWDAHWLAGTISDRIHLDALTDLTLSASGIRRPDYQFYGLGSDSLHADRSRYGGTRYEGNAALELKLAGLSRLTASVGARRVHFHHGDFSRDPTIEEAVAAGRYQLPPGWDQGYAMLTNQLSLAIDTRKARPAPGSGLRVEARLEQLTSLSPSSTPTILRYGGTIGGFWDLGQNGRVMSLSLATHFADPLRPADIPFTELVALGGSESMRGFPLGRLYGRSAAVMTLRYRWPIWIWLDGSIQLALGNVFDAHLGNFSAQRLRFSGSIGIESVGSPDSSLEILLGMGSETFEHGGEITSLRVVVGNNRGF